MDNKKMIRYAKYDEITGLIVSCGGTSSKSPKSAPGEAFLWLQNDMDLRDMYVDIRNKTLCPKRPIPYTISKSDITADGEDVTVITFGAKGVNDCGPPEIYLERESGFEYINDDVVEFSSLVAGDVDLVFRALNYLITTVRIRINEIASS